MCVKVLRFLKSLFFKSLQIKLVLVIVFVIFVPTIFLVNYNFIRTERVLEEKTSNLIIDSMQQIGNQIENVCLDIIKLSNVISTDKIIINTLSQIDVSENDEIFPDNKDIFNLTNAEALRFSKIEDQLKYSKAGIFFNYTADVMIIGKDGIIYNSIDNYNDLMMRLRDMKNFKKQDWYKKLTSEKQSILWTAPFYYNTGYPHGQDRFISVSRVIKNDYSKDILGIIMINISEEHFKTIMGNHATGVVSLLNENKDVIFSSDLEKVKMQLPKINGIIPDKHKGYFFAEIGRNKYMVNYYTLNRFNWNLISIIPYEEVFEEIRVLKAKIYSLNMVSFILFLIISIGLILYMTNPLKKLIGTIKNLKIGDYSVGLENEDDSDDVSGIVKSFHYMLGRIEELVKMVMQEQQFEHELKYEALRAQINPHFLFNTLNTIKWSARMSGAYNVSKMISALGKMLEISMNKGEEEITFKDELELAQSYVMIQNLRYNDKLLLNIEIDEDLKNYKVLKLILQPIIENSIIHGLKDKQDEGHITVKVVKEGNMIKADVTDNGKGISEEKINEIMADIGKDYSKQKFTAIGLRNIQERIKIKYGKEYGLKIFSQVGQGTTVSLILPCIFPGDEE